MVRVRYLPLQAYDVGSLKPFAETLHLLTLKVRPFHDDYRDLHAALDALNRISARVVGEPIRPPAPFHIGGPTGGARPSED